MTLIPEIAYSEVVAQTVGSNAIVVGEFHYKVVILWAIAHHRLAPLAIVRTGRQQNTISHCSNCCKDWKTAEHNQSL